jgi:hypothetical protein
MEASNMASARGRFWNQFRILADKHYAEHYPHKGEDWNSRRQVGERRPGVGDYIYHISPEYSDVTFEIYIRKGDVDETNRIYDRLYADSTALGESLNAPLKWQRKSDTDRSWISLMIEGGGYDNEDQWDVIQRNMLKQMERFMAALDPAVKLYSYDPKTAVTISRNSGAK